MRTGEFEKRGVRMDKMRTDEIREGNRERLNGMR